MQQAQAQAAQQAGRCRLNRKCEASINLEKQRLQNESVEKQVAIKAATSLAKGGGR